MAAPPKPQARVDVDPNFEKQLKALQTQAKDEGQQRAKGNPVKWMMPEPKNNWSGSLLDYAGMADAFNSKKATEQFVEAIKDPKKPGTVGDLAVATTQVDYLAVMERAFKARHTMTRARAAAQTAGRKTGHGSNKGVLVQAVLEHVRGMIKRSKSQGG